MKVARLLERRRSNWHELERLCAQVEARSKRRVGAANLVRFASLYRAACADLALADAYQLPAHTVNYLHQLVGRAHNQLYRSRLFHVATWAQELLLNVPRRLFRDLSLRITFLLFWGIFLGCMFCAYNSPQFTRAIVPEEQIEMLETMYEEPVSSGRTIDQSGMMAGFYVHHNAGIGLQCFAFGLLLGIGGLMVLISNAALLGTMFGHMATTEHRDNFFHFVTAHGPFELTAVVLSAAAGLHMGFGMVYTRGLTRGESLRRAARESVPTACAAIILFCLAALIEAFISPSSLPYEAKAAVAIVTTGMLMFYFVQLGYPRGE